jgi:hypothetical protein
VVWPYTLIYIYIAIISETIYRTTLWAGKPKQNNGHDKNCVMGLQATWSSWSLAAANMQWHGEKQQVFVFLIVNK